MEMRLDSNSMLGIIGPWWVKDKEGNSSVTFPTWCFHEVSPTRGLQVHSSNFNYVLKSRARIFSWTFIPPSNSLHCHFILIGQSDVFHFLLPTNKQTVPSKRPFHLCVAWLLPSIWLVKFLPSPLHTHRLQTWLLIWIIVTMVLLFIVWPHYLNSWLPTSNLMSYGTSRY